jgi:hypothetical protein
MKTKRNRMIASPETVTLRGRRVTMENLWTGPIKKLMVEFATAAEAAAFAKMPNPISVAQKHFREKN